MKKLRLSSYQEQKLSIRDHQALQEHGFRLLKLRQHEDIKHKHTGGCGGVIQTSTPLGGPHNSKFVFLTQHK